MCVIRDKGRGCVHCRLRAYNRAYSKKNVLLHLESQLPLHPVFLNLLLRLLLGLLQPSVLPLPRIAHLDVN
jgi:hypothetical protein